MKKIILSIFSIFIMLFGLTPNVLAINGTTYPQVVNQTNVKYKKYSGTIRKDYGTVVY